LWEKNLCGFKLIYKEDVAMPLSQETFFPTLHAFLQMGGYAAYVWTAYALVFLALFLNGFVALKKLRNTIKSLRK
jgi:heme exporter protein CcmD